MEITLVSASPGGAGQALGQRLVLTPVGATPLRVFRQAYFLRLSTGTLAEGLVPDAAATVLRGTFRPFDFDALTVEEPSLRANLTPKDGAVVVGLDAPRRVFQIVVAPAKVPAAGYALEVYRLDGEAIAEAPTVTAVNVAIQFRAPIGIGGIVKSPDRASGPAVGIGGGASDTIQARVGPPPFVLDFTDARFALRLKDPDDIPVALVPGDLEEVRIRSFPSGPRLGLAVPERPGVPGDSTKSVVFWRAPGEIGTTTPAGQGHVDAGEALAQELGRGVRRLIDRLRDAAPADAPPPVVPSSLDVALVIESDSPCRLDATALGVSYHLARRSFPAGEPKLVLRFDGGGGARRAIPIVLPGSATVRSAFLKTVASFRGDRPAGGSDEAVLDGIPAGQTGVLVGGNRSVAREITPPEALRLSGLAVGLMGLVPGTALRVQVREGQPSGRTLAAGIVAPGPVGRRGWASLRLADSVVLSSAPSWLVLTAASGQAVWLSRAGTAPVRVGDASDPATTWTEPAGFAGLETLYRPLSRGGGAAEDGMQPPVTVRLGETVLLGTSAPDDPDTRTYDLTAPLNAALADQPTADPREVSLTVSAAVPGMLTAYPPEVEFDLPP